jgi:hypothetical protein
MQESNLRRVENSLGDVRQRAAATHRHNGGMYIGNTPFSAIPNSMNQEHSKNASYIQNNIVNGGNFRLKNLLGEIPQKIGSVRFSRLKRNDFKISIFKNTQYQCFIITQ